MYYNVQYWYLEFIFMRLLPDSAGLASIHVPLYVYQLRTSNNAT